MFYSMYFLRTPLRVFGVILFMFSLGLTVLPGQVIDAGSLEYKATQRRTLDIRSNSPEVELLAKKALKTHGDFQLASVGKEDFKVKLDPQGDSSVQLLVDAQGRVVVNRLIQGSSLQRAVLKACDLVVEQLLGQIGYFSGDLFFVGDRGQGKDIYQSDLFFQQVFQLTHDKSDPIMPRLSPCGKALVYTTYFKSGFPDIYKIDLISKERTAIATYKGTNNGAAFSPDGHSMAMMLSSSDIPQLYVTDAKGRKPRRLTQAKSLKASPSWRKDGETIVYVSDELGGPQLFEVAATGGPSRRIPTQLSKYCVEPECHPKDRTIIFTAAVAKSFQIALYEGQKGSRFITQGPEDYIEPFWLADGRHILCTQRKKKLRRLCIVDTVTGKISLISPGDFGNASMACFRPPYTL